MTEVMTEPKTTPMPTATPTSAPAHEPVRRVGPPPPGEQPALLIEHATKRFVVGRKKKAVVAVNDGDAQVVNGVRLFSVLAINRCIAEICGEAEDPFQFPESRSDRQELYRSLISSRR